MKTEQFTQTLRDDLSKRICGYKENTCNNMSEHMDNKKVSCKWEENDIFCLG